MQEEKIYHILCGRRQGIEGATQVEFDVEKEKYKAN